MILSVGHTAIDHISKVPHFPNKNSSIYIKDYKKLRGGGAANVAAGIAKIGGKPALFSLVGEDFKQTDYLDYLKKNGVNLDNLVFTEKTTPRAFVYTDEEENQVTYFHWGASKLFSNQDLPENLEQYEIVHLAPSDPKFNLKVVEEAKKTSFDPGQDLPVYSSNQLKEIIEEVNILFCNQYELKKIKKKTKLSKNNLKKKVDILCVTYQEEGSKIFSQDKKIEIPAVKTRVKDPTGAGDAYRAGFLKTLVEERSLRKAGEIASTLASFVIEEVGCQSNLPNKEELEKRYEENFGA